MAKVIRKSNKKSNRKSNKRTNKNKKNNSRSKVMRGGDDGRYVLPPSYFGGKQNGYVSNYENLAGAVSQGTVSKDAKLAGPNLYPTMGLASGGGCGCGGKKSKSNLKKSRKSKSKSNKRQKH